MINHQAELSTVAVELYKLLEQGSVQLTAIFEFAEQVGRQEQELAAARQKIECQQADWERERDRQQQLLSDEYQELSSAWDRLEQEQRQLAIDRQAGGNSSFAQPAPSPSDTQTHSPAATSLNNLYQMPLPPQNSSRSTEPSSFQFQQLKREIGRHSGRNR